MTEESGSGLRMKPGEIMRLMSLVMGDVAAVGKDHENKQQGYKFRSIDDVYNAVQPALVKHGVFCTPQVVERVSDAVASKSGTAGYHVVLTIDHYFYAPDGSWVVSRTIGESVDFGDKAHNKAMSQAYKYALFQTFCIPTEEGGFDTENASGEHVAKPKPAPVQADEPDKSSAVMQGERKARADAKVKDYRPEYTAEEKEHYAKVILHLKACATSGHAGAWLERLTSFTGKEGATVPGRSQVYQLSGKRLTILYGKIDKQFSPEGYAEFLDSMRASEPEVETSDVTPGEPEVANVEDDNIPFEPGAVEPTPKQRGDCPEFSDTWNRETFFPEIQAGLKYLSAQLGESEQSILAGIYREMPNPPPPDRTVEIVIKMVDDAKSLWKRVKDEVTETANTTMF